jgi:NADPH:quinone reductase-like Zn-dependent oxidoreductase
MSDSQAMTSIVPATMGALRLHAPGGPSHLVYERMETHQPGPGEVLVRVHAAAITRDELGWPVDRLPAIPSYEFSGVVAELAANVEGVAIGDPVYALSGFDRDGAAADYANVSKEFLAPKPRTLGHIESAAIPLAALTAWQALFDHGNLKAGQRVLIHGAAGGVGSFAVQLARGHGAHLIGTASTGTWRLRGSLEPTRSSITRRRGSRSSSTRSTSCSTSSARRRRSPIRRPFCEPVADSFRSLPSPYRSVPPNAGSTPSYFVVQPNRQQLIELAKLVDCGELRPTIDKVFPLADADKTIERSLGDNRRGKIVLSVVDDLE